MPDFTPGQSSGARLSVGRIERVARFLAFALPAFGLPVFGVWLAAVQTAGAPGPARPILLLLLFGNLLFLGWTGWPGVLGALSRIGRRPPATAIPNGISRTAVLFPIYNEDPQAVFAAVALTARTLAEHGLDMVDVFVLSDTRDAAIAAAEEAEFARLQPACGDRVHYRRRATNTQRKAGNIADFCDQWGTTYDYMLVMDADSLMSARTIAEMIGLMDANPRTGMIQSVPYAFGRETPFARIQQFAARLYTPMLVEGLAFWQQGDSNYWGHNAIIRIAPFVAHCNLPVLPGKEPFGGEILCHDVVEAGLMRRGGWDVWMLPELTESYETLPANMVDFAQRERRWCQGNLQHLGVVGMRGLRFIGRYHLSLGILNYLLGPLLVGFTGLAVLDGLLGGNFITRLLGTPGWHGGAFVLLTFLLLYAAKLIALGAALVDGATARLFGGRTRLLASAVLEQAAAMVTAPVLLMFYTRFVVMMVLGRSVQWDAQPRDDRGVSWAEAWATMRMPFVTGLVWLVLAAWVGGATLTWSATLLPGLLLAVPFAAYTSYLDFGRIARRWGLFLTEDEVAPSPIQRAFLRSVGVDGVADAPLAPLSLAPSAQG
jgi:membrane glycosyltransferase